MSPLTQNSSPKFNLKVERKKPTAPFILSQKSLHIITSLWSASLFFMLLFTFPLHAQEIDPKTDPVNVEFSGPLAVIPEMISVEDAGNLADPITGLGAVREAFQIGKYPVTVLQWTIFLNAVHVVEGNSEDPRHLCHKEMFQESIGSAPLVGLTDVIRTKIDETNFLGHKVTLFFPKNFGTPSGHYFASLPMTGLSLDDCKRYLNWLHHGAPDFVTLCHNDPSLDLYTLSEKLLAITETGAYDFTNGKNGELMEGARYFLPSLNQWYKAAYHHAGTTDAYYWLYPTQSNELPFQSIIPDPLRNPNPYSNKTGANFAKIFNNYKRYYIDQCYEQKHLFANETIPIENLEYYFKTPVGFFTDSPSSYKTYDQGGNVREWTSDSVVTPQGEEMIAPGGSFEEASDQLLSTNANKKSFPASRGSRIIGLRVCSLASVDNLNKDPILLGAASNSPKSSLFLQSFENVFIAQTTAYGLEAALAVGIKRLETGEFISRSEILRPFTTQRNIVNAILSFFLAMGETGQATVAPIKKADFWNLGFVFVSTAATMLLTEGSAFVVEAAVGDMLNLLKNSKWITITVQNSVEELAWARGLTNAYYILLNSGLTTASDLKYFKEQEKPQEF
jgi:formylglycine-generating enzyme required for sulfatase activity